MEIQSEEFSTCKYQNNNNNDEIYQVKLNMDFHSHFSDGCAHNSATTFYHMKKSVQWMYENNLFIKDGIIYNT